MSEWEEQLNAILGDPGRMAQITDLAKTLMGGEGETEAPPAAELPDLGKLARSLLGGGEDAPETDVSGRLLRLLSGEQRAEDNRRRALLEAMKPYLSEKRRAKLDRAMHLARMAKLAQLVMGEEGKPDV